MHLKPGKDPANPATYRPISLLSCVGKLMERMISKRLKWYTEANNTLSPYQFGFRSNRSTLDPHAVLEHEIQICYRRHQVTAVAIIDLSSAFDKADIKPILYKLAKNGIRGKMLNWLQNYLQDRCYRVWSKTKFLIPILYLLQFHKAPHLLQPFSTTFFQISQELEPKF